MGLAYTIMAARHAAVALDRTHLSFTRGDISFDIYCRLYRLSGEGADSYEGGSARRIGSAGISARQDFAIALEDAGADVQPGDTFVHPHTHATCRVVDVKVITAEGLVCAKTAIARQQDGEA